MTDLFFSCVSNYRKGGTLWVLDDSEAAHFGNITRWHDYLSAKLFRLLRGGIGIVDRNIANPGRRHAFGIGGVAMIPPCPELAPPALIIV